MILKVIDATYVILLNRIRLICVYIFVVFFVIEAADSQEEEDANNGLNNALDSPIVCAFFFVYIFIT